MSIIKFCAATLDFYPRGYAFGNHQSPLSFVLVILMAAEQDYWLNILNEMRQKHKDVDNDEDRAKSNEARIKFENEMNVFRIFEEEKDSAKNGDSSVQQTLESKKDKQEGLKSKRCGKKQSEAAEEHDIPYVMDEQDFLQFIEQEIIRMDKEKELSSNA